MKIDDLLEKLQKEVESAHYVPLTNNIMLDKEEILDIIDEIRDAIPDDVNKAKIVVEEAERIKESAKSEASKLLRDAREQKEHLVNTNNITKNAYDEAEQIVSSAKQEANKYVIRSFEYMINNLSKVQEDLRGYVTMLEENKSELREKRKELSNRKE